MYTKSDTLIEIKVRTAIIPVRATTANSVPMFTDTEAKKFESPPPSRLSKKLPGVCLRISLLRPSPAIIKNTVERSTEAPNPIIMPFWPNLKIIGTKKLISTTEKNIIENTLLKVKTFE